MRHFYLALAVGVAITLQAAPPMTKELTGEKRPAKEKSLTIEPASMRTPMKVSVEELFACPENTVLDGPYIPDMCGYSGFQSSDQGRPGMPTKYYQAFHGCYKTVNAVRVIGMFNYFDEDDYSWYGCTDRGGIDETNTMTKPVTFEVSFYRMTADGFPGECVYSKNIDIVGRYIGVTYGSGDDETPMFEFMAELGEDIRLESGFLSFSAADTGEAPSCWFSLFTADTSMDYGCIFMGDYGMQFANLPCVFSLMGSGEFAAKKALKLQGITSPSATSRGTHEKVTVKVTNVGSEEINDATLQLILDGKEVNVETLAESLPSEGSCNYTFVSRVDLSEEGEHTIEVNNLTPGDEEISIMYAKKGTYTYADGECCESGSEYPDDEMYISRVKIGTIDNSSDAESYTDYMDTHITDLHAGEVLTLEIEPLETAVVGVWIDWNNDGTFSGKGESIGYIYDEPLNISIPEGLSVNEGIKRMRLVMDYYGEPEACGSYYFGETEDYGINVVRNAGSTSLSVSLDEISEKMNSNETKGIPFDLINEGEALLDATLSVSYTLPAIYEPRKLGRVAEFGNALKVTKPVSRAASEPSPDENVEQVLRYDGGFESSVALGNYSSAIFAHYYPAEVMRSIKGMTLSSIDVYINEVPSCAAVKVLGPGNGENAGTVLAEQVFTPVESSWNHIELDNPVVISGDDIWFGIELKDMEETGYYVGTDGMPAVAGYGDLCNVGGSTWWSMMELGIDHNFCIRGNVTGQRSEAINWLNLDKESVSIPEGNSATINAVLNCGTLPSGVYEASIDIKSNDELKPTYSIPVYLSNGVVTGIDVSPLVRTRVKVENGNVVVISDDNILSVEVYNVEGQKIAKSVVPGQRHEISIDKFGNAVYVFHVNYTDGTSEAFKTAVVR